MSILAARRYQLIFIEKICWSDSEQSLIYHTIEVCDWPLISKSTCAPIMQGAVILGASRPRLSQP